MNPLLTIALISAEIARPTPWQEFWYFSQKFIALVLIILFILFSIMVCRSGDEIFLLDNGKSPESDDEDEEEADSGEDSPAKIVITFRVKDDEENTPDTQQAPDSDSPAGIEPHNPASL